MREAAGRPPDEPLVLLATSRAKPDLIVYSFALRVAIVLLLLSVAEAGATRAQTAASAPTPSFDVSSIRRNVTHDAEMTLRVDPGGRLHVVAAPLFWLIAAAYGDANGGLRPEQVVGAPPWLRSERYDITAQTGAGVGETASLIAMRPFLRSLLEERFTLRTHRDRRELPVYALVRSRPNALGPRLALSTVDCSKDGAPCRFQGGPVGRIKSDALTSDILMQLLANASGRIVVDRTGLKGPFAIDLEWSQDQTASDKPSIFTAVQEQLGLKLEATRAPADVLVIDSVDRPTPD